MRLLFLGDVVGKVGRNAVLEQLPTLRRRLAVDFCVVNGENSAGGFGITAKIAEEFYEAGADCITTGNHVWDQRELLATIDADPKMLRPANFPPGTPGRGAALLEAGDGKPRGVGEPPIGPVAAAVGNAFFALTRTRLRQIPFTPARIAAAMG